MIFQTAFVLATVVATASARCDNGCSGHGDCTFDDVCRCYDNWGVGLSMDSGDCSERICPFELAFVDNPNAAGSFHGYTECAGKGICDRSSGECQCFDGYEGKGCQRTTCPNDCSGHGTCEYIEDLGYGVSWSAHADSIGFNLGGDKKTFDYQLWNVNKIRGCVCDAQYTDVDCSKRLCPRGNDVLDQRDNLLVSANNQKQRIKFYTNKETGYSILSLEKQTFAITFISTIGETFTTIPLVMDLTSATNGADSQLDMKNDIENALENLPNKVIDQVKATITMGDSSGYMSSNVYVTVDIEFSGDAVQGTQNLLEVESFECASGCTPKITGLDLMTVVEMADQKVSSIQTSDFNSFECGRRGKCDYDTGLCECFTGYSGEICGTVTTLV